jgi:hypothetical protein
VSNLTEALALLADSEVEDLQALTTRLLSDADATNRPVLLWLNLMARADQIWDISYDYVRVRGMIWLARAALSDASDSPLKRSLLPYTDAYLHYTAAENAFVSSDPARMAHHSRQSARLMAEVLANMTADDVLFELFTARSHYFQGAQAFTERLITVLDGTASAEAVAESIAVIEAHMTAMRPADPELFTELRAHRIFLGHHARLAASSAPEDAPVRADATVVLGVNTYVDDDLMKRVTADAVSGEVDVKAWLGLSTADDFAPEALQDVFETALGAENMRALVLSLEPMALHYRGKTYAVVPTIRLVNLGVLALEYAVELQDADELELQAVVDLISPHAPEALFLPEPTEDLPDILHPFLAVDALPDGGLRQTCAALIAEATSALAIDPDINTTIAPLLAAIDAALSNCERPEVALLRQTVRYLRDRSTALIKGFLAGMHATYGLDVYKACYDVERDWTTMVTFHELRVSGEAADWPELKDRRRLHWMLAPSRESKASLADWVGTEFAIDPADNLAAIRSHRADFLFIRGSQASMYFPDDPYYLIDYEYAGTLRLMLWMRTLVGAFTELSVRYNQRSHYLRQAFLSLSAHPRLRDVLRSEVQVAEHFKLEADEKLSLLQECLMSRYDDHARLLRAVVEKMDLERSRAVLSVRLDKVIATQDFLDRQTRAVVDRAREDRQIRREKLGDRQKRFVQIFSTTAAGLYGSSLLTLEWVRYGLMAVVLTPVAVLVVRTWLEGRKMQEAEEAAEAAAQEKLLAVEAVLNERLKWRG